MAEELVPVRLELEWNLDPVLEARTPQLMALLSPRICDWCEKRLEDMAKLVEGGQCRFGPALIHGSYHVAGEDVFVFLALRFQKSTLLDGAVALTDTREKLGYFVENYMDECYGQLGEPKQVIPFRDDETLH